VKDGNSSDEHRAENLVPTPRVFRPKRSQLYLLDKRDWDGVKRLVEAIPDGSTWWKDFGILFLGAGAAVGLGLIPVGDDIGRDRVIVSAVVAAALGLVGVIALLAGRTEKAFQRATTKAATNDMERVEASFVDEGIEASVREEIAPDQNSDLTLQSLNRFVFKYVDLQRWERLGVSAGLAIWMKGGRQSDPYGFSFEVLFLTLRSCGVKSIGQFVTLLDQLDTQAFEKLRALNTSALQHGQHLASVGEDVLVFLISGARTAELPADFDWGGAYTSPVLQALRHSGETST
jgi:hypothetical protein